MEPSTRRRRDLAFDRDWRARGQPRGCSGGADDRDQFGGGGV